MIDLKILTLPRFILVCFCLGFCNLLTLAQTAENPETSLPSEFEPWPGLRWLDASHLKEILQNQPGLLKIEKDKKTSIVWARKVSLKRKILANQDFPGKDGPWYLFYTPMDPSRWDLLINGELVDPRDFLIEYRGTIVNLALLFTYSQELRNLEQYPASNF